MNEVTECKKSVKKLKVQKQGSPDNFQTPEEALDFLIPFLKKEWVVWEPAEGTGNLVRGLIKRGFKVVSSDKEFDFLKNFKECDCIITNPPYSLKQEFLERCYLLGKPFALLMPLTALESERRQDLYRKYGLQMIIPNKRINFETPSGKQGGAWFLTAWFSFGLNLPKDINFVKC